VDIAVEVNEKILGGLQIMIGDKFIDLSVSSRVDDLYRTLENTL
jgi:F0F1-type ATP synthase delta subunit